MKLWLFSIFTSSLLIVCDANADSSKDPFGFKYALPGYQYSFPKDHFSHDDYKVEWWYYTGNLKGKNEREFGFQLTFFRVALDHSQNESDSSRWRLRDIYFAHMTVSDIENKKFYFFERLNRSGLGNAGAESDRFLVWNEDWVLTKKEETQHLRAVERGFGLDLNLKPIKSLVMHGKDGISKKGNEKGNASHYFSFTRMKTWGKIYLNEQEFEVSGTGWMDREFSSSQLNKEQVGWDWFSIKLDNQTELMLYRIRVKNGSTEPFSSGTIVFEDGSNSHLELKDFSVKAISTWRSEKTGAVYPASWIVTVPKYELSLKIIPDFSDQELYQLRSIAGAYWEGSVTVTGVSDDKSVNGKGYVELVGYDKALDTGPVN